MIDNIHIFNEISVLSSNVEDKTEANNNTITRLNGNRLPSDINALKRTCV
jgi:hypothetical protein